jgi:hypothetical protein
VHGTTTEDPWFWLRERDDPEVIAYLEAQRPSEVGRMQQHAGAGRNRFENGVASVGRQHGKRIVECRLVRWPLLGPRLEFAGYDTPARDGAWQEEFALDLAGTRLSGGCEDWQRSTRCLLKATFTCSRSGAETSRVGAR